MQTMEHVEQWETESSKALQIPCKKQIQTPNCYKYCVCKWSLGPLEYCNYLFFNANQFSFTCSARFFNMLQIPCNMRARVPWNIFLMQIYFLFDDPLDIFFDANHFFSWCVTRIVTYFSSNLQLLLTCSPRWRPGWWATTKICWRLLWKAWRTAAHCSSTGGIRDLRMGWFMLVLKQGCNTKHQLPKPFVSLRIWVNH